MSIICAFSICMQQFHFHIILRECLISFESEVTEGPLLATLIFTLQYDLQANVVLKPILRSNH